MIAVSRSRPGPGYRGRERRKTPRLCRFQFEIEWQSRLGPSAGGVARPLMGGIII